MQNPEAKALSIVSDIAKKQSDPKKKWIVENIMPSLLWQESRYNPYALSPRNARGMAQLVPETARELGLRVSSNWKKSPKEIDERTNTEKSVQAGARYLLQQWDMVNELLPQESSLKKLTLALQGYNWGPGNLRKHIEKNSQVPEETRKYPELIYGHARNRKVDFKKFDSSSIDGKKKYGNVLDDIEHLLDVPSEEPHRAAPIVPDDVTTNNQKLLNELKRIWGEE